MPKYIWRTSLYYRNELFLDLLFDATDIMQGPCFLRPIGWHEGLMANLVESIGDFNSDNIDNCIVSKILKWFKKLKIKDVLTDV